MAFIDEVSKVDKRGVARTLTGYVDVYRPDASSVRVLDMSWSLSMICRYNGQVPFFYSVAEHSVLATRLSETLCPDMRCEVRLAVLCHDLHEAYVGDLISPVKVFVPEYGELEKRWEEAVREALGLRLSVEEEGHLGEVDHMMKLVEMYCFYEAVPDVERGEEIVVKLSDRCSPRGWNPGTAHEEFTTALKSLWKQGAA